MSSAYAIRSPIFLTGISCGLSFVREMPRQEAERRVDFHIKSKDYFGTLATLMTLMADKISSGDARARARCVTTLKELSEDLLYLQEQYLINRK